MKLVVILLCFGAIHASNLIHDEFLLGLKPDYDSGVFASKLKQQYGLKLKGVWDIRRTKIMYLTGEVDMELLRELPEVKYVGHNAWARLHQEPAVCDTYPHPGVWGLDRIDQRERLPYSTPTDTSAEYHWETYPGLGVNAYVVDTGIFTFHDTFEGRASHGYTADGIGETTDGNGHGTHTAGTLGSLDYGVAKKVNLIAVIVVNNAGTGTSAHFIDGLQWILTQHVFGVDRSVVSMSLGYGSRILAVDDLLSEMTDMGIHLVASAGNDQDDACEESPGGAPAVITAGAVDVTDTAAYFTSYGSCVEVHAPGVEVLSAALLGGSAVMTGTSMSAPHVAGVVARYLSSTTGTPPTPAEARAWIMAEATVDVITFTTSWQETSPNRLLYATCYGAAPK